MFASSDAQINAKSTTLKRDKSGTKHINSAKEEVSLGGKWVCLLFPKYHNSCIESWQLKCLVSDYMLRQGVLLQLMKYFCQALNKFKLCQWHVLLESCQFKSLPWDTNACISLNFSLKSPSWCSRSHPEIAANPWVLLKAQSSLCRARESLGRARC